MKRSNNKDIMLQLAMASLMFATLTLKANVLYPYGIIALGYKIQQPDYVIYNGEKLDVDFGGKDSVFFELGFETDSPISFGVKHDSQASSGFPFNNEPEYYKSEVFIKYKIGGK